MTRVLITLALSLVVAVRGLSQPQAERQEHIRRLVAELSWNSVVEECNWFWNVHVAGEAADKLIEIGKPATDQLIQALRHHEKAVAAHLVLCSIWAEEASANCSGFIDDVHGVPFHYQFGQLRFTSDSRVQKTLDRQMLVAVERSWITFVQANSKRPAG